MERPTDPRQTLDPKEDRGAVSSILAAARQGVTLRSLLVTGILVPINDWWLYQMQDVWSVGNPTILSLYFNVVFILALLTVGNLVLRRVAPTLALAQAELLTIYTLLSITTSCAAYDFMHWFPAAMAGVAYSTHGATPANRWREIFFDDLPLDMTVRDQFTLKYMHEGGVSFYGDPALWGPWVGPALLWILMLCLLWVGPLGLAVLFRRRWIDVERLTFPIVQLPFEMTRERPTVFRDKVLWTAFTLAFLINLTNGLSVLKPIFPAVPVKVGWDPNGGESFEISKEIIDTPWNAATSISLAFYPMIIGFGLLIPTELSISCVLFFFLFKGELIATRWLGIQGKPEFPYLKEQSLGGYLGILIFSLWVGRRYYADLARRVLRRDPERDSQEPVSYRTAALLFLGCFVALVVLAMSLGPRGMKFGSGMIWWQAIFHWGMYFVLTLVCGRIRAEMGLPVHEIERLGPVVLLGNVFGVMRGGKVSQDRVRSLTVASLFFPISRGMRSIAFPHEVEGFKLQDRCGGNQSRLFKAMLGALIVGMFAAWAIYLPTMYHYGAAAKMQQYAGWHTGETYNQLVNWIESPEGLAWNRIIPTIIGFVVYVVLMTLKMRLPWWPLHPIGLALSSTWYMHHMWCPFLIAWILKVLATRYGGHRGARALAPIAYGLILGDVISGCGWTIYGALTQQEVYAFWN
ncbi:MAG: hypothetical protein GF320_08120 [Armatimonadia bacterium]|nr:hypothetical protein [Armatimonadia bacterium]